MFRIFFSIPPRGGRASSLALPALLVALAGCGGDDPFALRWQGNPQEVVLHSLALPSLNVFSAYDIINRIPIRVEASNTARAWDVAVDTRNGQLVFIPPGALGIFPTDDAPPARITRIPGVSFDDVVEAPGDTTLYSVTEPVAVETGSVYVVQTREGRDRFGRPCSFFAKLEPVSVNQEQGTVRFVFDRNPICEDRDLVPDAPADTASAS